MDAEVVNESDWLSPTSIRRAHDRIRGHVRRTPLLSSKAISESARAEVRLKAEHLQHTGSFKVRGAFNRLLAVDPRSVAEVVTASSGNHGQAVAYAARALGIKPTVVLPENAAPIKVEAARAYGATLEFSGTTSAQRLARARSLAHAHRPFIAPYDDYLVMAGQGTVGLEILGQFAEVEVVVVPIGGGGLISGIAVAIKCSAPHVRVIGVEPEGAAKVSASLAQGRPMVLTSTASIADGLKALTPGELTWPFITQFVDEVVTVSDEEIADTVRFLAERAKQVVEPSGAAALAYVIGPQKPCAGKKVVAVLSGGNIDWATLATL